MTILSTNPIDIESIYQESFFQECDPDIQQRVKHRMDGLTIQELWYNSGGRRVKGYVVHPKDISREYPVVLYARGGSKDFGIITDKVLTFMLARIASWGFVVLATQYSGTDGSEGKDEYSGMDLDDLENLKNVAEELPYADSEDIRALGGSRGGLMIANLCRRVSWVKRVVLECPELDVIDNYQRRPELQRFRSDMYDVFDESLNRAKSPIYHVDELCRDTQYVLIQGGRDWRVSPEKVIELFGKMRQEELQVDLHFFDREEHQISLMDGLLWKVREQGLSGYEE